MLRLACSDFGLPRRASESFGNLFPSLLAATRLRVSSDDFPPLRFRDSSALVSNDAFMPRWASRFLRFEFSEWCLPNIGWAVPFSALFPALGFKPPGLNPS